MDGIEHGLKWSLGLYEEPVCTERDAENKSVTQGFDSDLGSLTLKGRQEIVELSAERNMYKTLYEDLVAKVIK